MFPRPAVRRVLEERYVEARLHTDGDANIDRILEVRDRFADGNVANPYYVIVDPRTNQRLDTFPGGTPRESVWLDFLERQVRVGRR